MNQESGRRRAIVAQVGKLLGVLIKMGGSGEEAELAQALTQGMKNVPTDLPPPRSFLPFVTQLLLIAESCTDAHTDTTSERMLRYQLVAMRDQIRIAIADEENEPPAPAPSPAGFIVFPNGQRFPITPPPQSQARTNTA